MPSVSNKYKSVNNFPKANFVAARIPDCFANLASSLNHEAKTIQEFWKVVKQCNRVINHSTGSRAFNKAQEIQIGIRGFKEFAMKVKAGTKMIKGQFAYFNGIVNKLMTKLYIDEDFITGYTND